MPSRTDPRNGDAGAGNVPAPAKAPTPGMPRRNPDEPIYTISIAARLVRPLIDITDDHRPLHAQTLRTYEREGLVKPRRVGRNRLYSDRDIERLQKIQHYTQERGVNLAGVEIILDLLDMVKELEGRLEEMAGE
jgi:MerR family transcriptional regulator/heat shock protein HspR